MAPVRRSGPMDGHWMTTLRFIDSTDDGCGFVCTLWSGGKQHGQSTFRSARNASNLYSHVRLVYPSIHVIISLVTSSLQKSKKPITQSTTISDIMVRSQQRSFDESLLCLFASPDVSNRLFGDKRFQNVLKSINPNVRVPSRATIVGIGCF